MRMLNVVLHGLFAVVEEPYRVVAAVPLIKDHHNHLIGVQNGSPAAFYGRGTYELLGIDPIAKPASIPTDRNAKIRGAGPTEVFATSPPARSVFILPRPYRVTSCRCFKVGTDIAFTGTDAAAITATQCATINVLTYPFDDIDELQFTGLPTLDFEFSDASRSFVNVGIISTGSHLNMVAVSAAFDKLMADLVPGKVIHLNQLTADPQPMGLPCTGIPGADAATFEILLGLQLNDGPDDCVSFFVDNT